MVKLVNGTEVPETQTDLDQQAIDQQPKPVTEEAVIKERERRFALGFDYDFGDSRGVHSFGTTDADMKGWEEVTTAAQALINANQPTTAIDIITETGPCTVTAFEWQAILIYVTQVRQPIWAASFTLQAMDPIPQNYTDNSHWI